METNKATIRGEDLGKASLLLLLPGGTQIPRQQN